MNKTPSHLIWDWNGTLLDDVWLCVDVISRMLEERGLPIMTMERYRDIFDFPVKDYYEKIGFDFVKEPFEIVGMEFIDRYNERKQECNLHRGVREVLDYLKSKKIKHSILSARHEASLKEELDLLSLAGFFEYVSGLSDNYASGKVESGKRLIHMLGLPKSEIIFVGDTTHDAEVAFEIGVRCIMIPNGHHTEERLSRCNCIMIDSVKDLPKTLGI